MKIEIEITEEALSSAGAMSCEDGIGAVVEFAGIVRGEENGQRIAALRYEAYETMARSQTEQILRDLQATYPCAAVRVIHRVGVVPAGEAAIVVRVEAKHRAEAFGMLAAFMDRLKQEVPIWKSLP